MAGYGLAKAIGVKVMAEMPAAHRVSAIVGLIALDEAALIAVAVAPPLAGIVALFANGLALGVICRLVFAFLEGRRLSQVLGAMLCASIILSSGFVVTDLNRSDLRGS